jgi:penicillin-binding protein 1A
VQTLFQNDPEDKKPAAAPVASEEERAEDAAPLHQRSVFSSWRGRVPPIPVTEIKSHLALRRITFGAMLLLSALFGVMIGLMLIYGTNLPQIDELTRYRPDTTTELLDIHGQLFGSFALERRVVVPYSDFPPVLREAIISIEDKSFEKNAGVNLIRVLGAAYRDLRSHGKEQGASTLTMQLSRNLFLSSERSFGRKMQEIFLTIQIERRFTKPQIFTLYANQIYLGHGVFGFEAGSEFYFSKHVKDLTLPEAALLAALPKGPEGYSPLKYPERALKRRNLVINEMLQDGKISEVEANAAKATPLGLHLAPPPNSIAPWFVEEVRKQLEQEFGPDEVHEDGLRVYTTLDLDLQKTANKAVQDGLATYERRHGWKGNLQNVVLGGESIDTYRHPDWTISPDPGTYLHALVLEASPNRVLLRVGALTAAMTPEDWRWTGQKDGNSFLKAGDIVYVRIADAMPGTAGQQVQHGDAPLHAQLEQDSGAQASLMAVDNSDGEVLAMVGGRDYNLSQFNRATQAERQVGSSFKPYVYATAVEAGAKPTDLIVDGPTTFNTPGGPYTPHNYEGDYKGAMTLLNAFAESRNIPALKLADRVGISKVVDMVHRFGVTSPVPLFLPVAIGAADLTLYEQVASYSVFPNDGIRLAPHYIRKVTTTDGMALQEQDANSTVQAVIDVQTARTMMTFLQAVTKFGTAAAAQQLKHPLGGKTGTTNDFTDAWFIGFSPSVTCGTWVGFDDPSRTLGEKETGAQAALPIWMDFMRVAIAGKPDEVFPADDVTKNQPGAAAPAAAPAPSPIKPTVPKLVVIAPASAKPATAPDQQPAAVEPAGAPGGDNAVPAAHPAQSAPSAPPQ